MNGDKNKKIANIIGVVLPTLALILIIVAIAVAIAILPHDDDVKFDDAVRIAKKNYGCERVLWIGLVNQGAEWFIDKTESGELEKSKYYYYVVGEKDGKEIYFLLSDDKNKKAIFVEWLFDFTFREIIAKLNEYGAEYQINIPDDFYGETFDRAELIWYVEQENSQWDTDMLARLDVRVRFEFERKTAEKATLYTLTQESGTLCVYMHLMQN